MCRNCQLENESARPAYNMQEAETLGQVARVVPRIYKALEDRQADHQSTVVEVAGKIVEQSVSIFIDPRSTHSYITPRVVEIFAFKKLSIVDHGQFNQPLELRERLAKWQRNVLWS